MAETKLTEDGLPDIYTGASATSDKNLYLRNGYTADNGKGMGPLTMAANDTY